MTQRILTVMSLVVLMITAGCLGMAAPSTDSIGGIESNDGLSTGVTVSTTGSIAIEPDLAVVTIAVEATADSADDARGQVATDVAAVRQALADLGVAEDAVMTVSFQLYPEYDYTRESREFIGYRAVHVMTIEADVDQAGAVIDAAVGAGAVRVSGVQFTLSDESQQSAREHALRVAMDNAEADASTLADAADVTLGSVRSASTASPVVIPFEARTGMAEADGGTTLEPGPVQVSATVHVVYDIA